MGQNRKRMTDIQSGLSNQFFTVLGEIVIRVRTTGVGPIKDFRVDTVRVASKQWIRVDVAGYLGDIGADGFDSTERNALIVTGGFVT